MQNYANQKQKPPSFDTQRAERKIVKKRDKTTQKNIERLWGDFADLNFQTELHMSRGEFVEVK
jgi:hypothetical protein